MSVTIVLMVVLLVVVGGCSSTISGAAAPDFELLLYDRGEPLGDTSLSRGDLEGEPAVLNFWATWCAPCRAEMPALERLHQQYKSRGVQFLGIDMGVSMLPTEVNAFLDEAGVTYQVGFPENSRIAVDYGVAALPGTVFVRADGTVARTWVGIISEDQLAEQIENLLNS